MDGYYALVPSEINIPDEKTIHRYRGHLLLCFVALLMARLLEIKLFKKYSVRRIQEDLGNVYTVSLNHKNTRIQDLKNYLKEIVHNIKTS